MSALSDEILVQVQGMSDMEKLRLVDWILTHLDKPDPEIDRVWSEEAGKRWAAYRAGKLKTIPYSEVMAKYQKR